MTAMPSVSFSGLAAVASIAFAVPLLVGLAPRARIPSVVIEILVGIIVGPSVLGWVTPDAPIRTLAIVGLAFLLFLAGLEIDIERLRGRFLRLSGLSFVVSLAIGLAIGLVLDAAGLVHSPLFFAIVMSATSLGLVIPLLKDQGLSESEFGQLTIAAASIADFAAVVLLSLFFSATGGGIAAKVALLIASSSSLRPSASL